MGAELHIVFVHGPAVRMTVSASSVVASSVSLFLYVTPVTAPFAWLMLVAEPWMILTPFSSASCAIDVVNWYG